MVFVAMVRVNEQELASSSRSDISRLARSYVSV
jgi:hypothetical protein